MPDQPDPSQDPDRGVSQAPSPVEEHQVQRLLHEVRHQDPVPLEVVERLEHALAVEAEAAAAGRPATAPVLPLDQRRRHRAVALLVAAVAIVVVGVGIGQVLRPAVESTAGSTSDIDRRAAAGQASRSGAPDRGTDTTSEEEAEGSDTSDAAPPVLAPREATSGTALLLGEDPPEVRSTRFARDVRVVRRDVVDLRLPMDPPTTGDFACESASWGPGRAVATLLDGTPSVLVVRPEAGETQVVDLLQCGSGDVLRSVTLPAL